MCLNGTKSCNLRALADLKDAKDLLLSLNGAANPKSSCPTLTPSSKHILTPFPPRSPPCSSSYPPRFVVGNVFRSSYTYVPPPTMSFGLPSPCVPPLDSSSPRATINVHHQPFSASDSSHSGVPPPSPPIASPPCSFVGDPSPSPLVGRASSSPRDAQPPPIADGLVVPSPPMAAPFAKLTRSVPHAATPLLLHRPPFLAHCLDHDRTCFRLLHLKSALLRHRLLLALEVCFLPLMKASDHCHNSFQELVGSPDAIPNDLDLGYLP
ncbi:hypothetical protein Salat_2530000 [Sesamum alatum]|uniref:Uncharacterized protein n=1 Tax=Sesamum alatum TaxID=300844 RepID=A0AAE1XS26_9LAMI|nr:hypothetical protein Salat_2530000 [Sesamum alatum]